MLGDLRLRPRSQWRGILTLSLSKRRLEPEAGGWLDRRQNGDDEGQGTQRRPSMYSSCGKAAIDVHDLSCSEV